MSNAHIKSIGLAAIIVVISILLGLFTTSEWINVKGIYYLENRQLNRYSDILQGDAGNPWQYRVLAPFIIRVISHVFEYIHISSPITVAFIFLRAVQDISIILFSYIYFRYLGLSFPHALIGMAILAWGISYSHYDSDLSFNVFFDIIFYLLACLCVMKRKYIWIIPITLLAAFNRETSGLIPFLPLVSSFVLFKGSFRKVIPIFLIALLTYIAVFIGLRYAYGKQEIILAYGHHWGLDMLQYNLFRLISWRQEFATLSIIPIIALIGYKKWAVQLQVYFWTIVPIWFFIHLLGAVMAESRLYLIPQALAFIPGALFTISQQVRAPENNSVS